MCKIKQLWRRISREDKEPERDEYLKPCAPQANNKLASLVGPNKTVSSESVVTYSLARSSLWPNKDQNLRAQRREDVNTASEIRRSSSTHQREVVKSIEPTDAQYNTHCNDCYGLKDYFAAVCAESHLNSQYSEGFKRKSRSQSRTTNLFLSKWVIQSGEHKEQNE